MVRVNSRERDNLSDPTTSFRISFQNMKCCQHVHKVVVKHVSIPNAGYSILAPLGDHAGTNTISYSVSGSGLPVTTITIAEGNYSITELFTAIEADAAAIAVGLSFSIDTITGLVSATSTTNITLLAGNTTIPIGLAVDTTFGLVHTLTEFPDLSGDSQLYLVSSEIADGNNLIDKTLSHVPVFAVIPITVGQGFVEEYSSPHPEIDDIEYKSPDGVNLQSFEMKVYTDKGRLLDLKGLDWQIVLKVYH